MATARIEIGDITEIEENGKTIFQRDVQILCDSGIMFYETLTSRDRASIEIYGTPPEEED